MDWEALLCQVDEELGRVGFWEKWEAPHDVGVAEYEAPAADETPEAQGKNGGE